VSAEHFHRDNHYVPQGYLKQWASPQKRLWVYRILVSHTQVPAWKEASVKEVAHHSHLYTRIAAGQETDDFERWLDREFETPAEDPLRKVTSGARLTPDDWKHLVRFVAAQDVRTPARLVENLQWWPQILPDILDNTLRDSLRELQQARETGEVVQQEPTRDTWPIPLRVTKEIEPGHDAGKLKAEVVVGRGLWLFSMRHLLTKTVTILQQQKWTILSPPEGMYWLTSDDPVIKLNYYRPGEYDFKGSWGNPGTEILLPLSPRHLIYTRVGYRPPRRGEIPREAEMIQRFIAEHAHRLIFAVEPNPEVLRLRRRTVNADLWQDESDQWDRWHDEQTAAEREPGRSGQEQQVLNDGQ
jgi:Protein of unknown function (DUF4238)